MLRNYLKLTKPGVMFGNLLTTLAGFLFASHGNFDWQLFLGTAIGTAFIISSACVINNVLDQDIDAKMERTKNRPLVSGGADPTIATIFGIALGLFGFIILATFTNTWVVGAGIVGFASYVWLYGALSKRRSIHGTLVGAISGATPILAGYVAVKPGLDTAAILLFLILFFWQMPEFYSIAIYRRKEYKKARVPVITVQKSLEYTVNSIFLYSMAYIVTSLALFAFGYTSYTYVIIMGALNLYWIVLVSRGLRAAHINVWAKQMFRYTLVVLLIFSGLISLDHWLP